MIPPSLCLGIAFLAVAACGRSEDPAYARADPDVVDQAYRGMSNILRGDLPVAFILTDFATPIVHRRVK